MPNDIPAQSRLTQWATDVKALVALITGITSVLLPFVDTLRGVTAKLGVPTPVAVLLFAAICVITLRTSLQRRSRLIQPARFLVSADDPHNLFGREQEVAAILSVSQRHPVVYLVGESGGGKTAIIKGGVARRLAGGADGLIPLIVDLSAITGEGALTRAIARAITATDAAARTLLGSPDAPGLDEAFEWLASLPADARCKPLIILDQFDDYLLAHRGSFVRDNVVLTPADVALQQPEWASLARITQAGHTNLLFVMRDDASSVIGALRFVADSATFLVPSLDPQLISPLLDAIAAPSGDGNVVVSDPESGWVQLKKRLIRDLSSGHRILPIELAVTLDSLRRLPFLTPREYDRHGRAPGLLRVYLRRHLQEASRSSGVPQSALLRGLLLLVTDDGLKTQSVEWHTFARAVVPPGTDQGPLRLVTENLVHQSVLKSHTDAGRTLLLLHHDYLARGLRDLYREDNPHTELLRERSREFHDASDWLARWRALLPLTAQFHLFRARIRGGFRYAEYRSIAALSTLRFFPFVVLGIAIISAFLATRQVQEDHLAEMTFGSIEGTEDTPTAEEGRAWMALAQTGERARFHFVEFGLSTPDRARRVYTRLALAAHVAVGLDNTGVRSQRLALRAVTIAKGTRDAGTTRGAAFLITHLHLVSREANLLGQQVANRIHDESDAYTLGILAQALMLLAPKVERVDGQHLCEPLLQRLASEDDAERAASVTAAFVPFIPHLEEAQLRRVIGTMTHWVTVPRHERSERLVDAAWQLCAAVPPKISHPLALALLQRAKTDSRRVGTARVARLFASAVEGLPAHDRYLAASELLADLTSGDPNDYALPLLGSALASLSGTLERNAARSMATEMSVRILTTPDRSVALALGRAFGELAGVLGSTEAGETAAQLLARAELSSDRSVLPAVAAALSGLRGPSQATQLDRYVTLLSSVALRDKSPQAIRDASEAVSILGSVLSSEAKGRIAEGIAQRLSFESNYLVVREFAPALETISPDLAGPVAQHLASQLVDRIARDPNPPLPAMHHALSAMAAHLGTPEALSASALLDRMGRESNLATLQSLASIVSSLHEVVDPQSTQTAASILRDRIAAADASQTTELARALLNIANRLEAKDLQPAVHILLGRLTAAQGSVGAAALAEQIGLICNGRLPTHQRAVGLEVLGRLKRESAAFAFISLARAIKASYVALTADERKAVTSVIVQRMKRTQSGRLVGVIGATLVDLAEPTVADRIRDAVDVLRDRMSVECEMDALADLAFTWTRMNSAGYGSTGGVAVSDYEAVLSLPLAVDNVRRILLSGLEGFAGVRFEGDIWKFVDWRERSPRGRTIRARAIGVWTPPPVIDQALLACPARSSTRRKKRMWSGVLPQQPPMTRAPASSSSPRRSPISSGVSL
jgi:hypothetical protein